MRKADSTPNPAEQARVRKLLVGWRKERGKSQSHASRISGIAWPKLSLFENCYVELRAEELTRLERALVEDDIAAFVSLGKELCAAIPQSERTE
jgi:hypothetical protein